MFYSFLLFFSLASLSLQTVEWSDKDYHPPLSIHPSISGTYGELRSNHFHSGIDFRTQGVVGHALYTIDDAYVSRIRVLSASYGNVLYLTHPDGYSSVYAHMENFHPEIQAYVREQQYKRKTFEIELFPPAHLFTFKRGEQIGTAGNSGYSYGPHLHFEVRNENHVPLNPMAYHFNIRDDVPPQIRQVAAYPLDTRSLVNGNNHKAVYSVIGQDGSYSLRDTIEVYGQVGFGIEVYDFLTDSRNRCGVYRIQLYIDDLKIYAHTIDAIPFHVTRFINALLDYEELVENRVRIQKSFVKGFNRLPIYDHLVNQGIFTFHENRTYELRYVTSDFHGNSAELKCVLRFNNEPKSDKIEEAGVLKMFSYETSNRYEDEHIVVETPAYAFYDDFPFYYEISDDSRSDWAPHIQLGNPGVPIHKPIRFEVRSPDIKQHPKADFFTLAFLNNKGEFRGVAGELTTEGLAASIRNFGVYALLLDTIAPEITPINIANNKNMQQEESIRFTVLDNLSGIAEYTGYINNEWVLFEYDLKNNLLLYRFDDDRITRGQHHTLELYVSDGMSNMATYYTRFYY